MSNDNVLELKRLNSTEIEVITEALHLFTEDKLLGWAAKAMLEDDAKFVRGMFWTSEEKDDGR